MLFTSFSDSQLYSPEDYFWPVFSVRTFSQTRDGWFHYKPEKRRKRRRLIS